MSNREPPNLTDVSLPALITELRSRCKCSLLALILKEAPLGDDTRVFMQADADTNILLLGLTAIAYDDVLSAVKEIISKPPPEAKTE